jgi:hypothetical protein
VGFPWDAVEREAQALQAELAALVLGVRQVIAPASGQYIHAEQPDLIIDATRQVVAAVRDPSGWATPASPGSMFGSGQCVSAASLSVGLP